ncbi:MAG: clostripain-related cysteine peptidase [bacterium]
MARVALALALLALAATPAAALPTCAAAWGGPEAWSPGQDYAAFRVEKPRAGCRKRWTVLLYLAGDAEDLVAPMDANIQALRDAGGSTADLDVVVLRDELGPTGLKRLHVFADGLAEAGGFADESRPPEELLRRFLQWGVAEYPADHYMVVLAGHGLGWRPTLPDLPAEAARFDLRSKWGGFGFDATDGTVLDTPALRRALESVVDGPLGGRPLDVLLSDACLMQSLEVLTELADVARYVGGSEQVQPYRGLPYAGILKRLRRPPTDPVDGCADGDSPCRLARTVASEQLQTLERDASVEAEIRARFTYSVVDTSALRLRVLPALADFADAASALIVQAPESSFGFATVLADTPGFLGGTRDLGAWLARVEGIEPARRGGAHAALHAAARAAHYALDTAVVDRGLGKAYRADARGEYVGMLGVALWLPVDQADRDRRLPFFAGSRLHRTLGVASGEREGRWPRLLSLIYEPPVPAESCAP